MTAERGMLLPSLDRVRRTIAVETAFTLTRLQVLERLPGNPVGVAYRHVDDGVVAMMARHIPAFNAVTGLRSGLERHVAPLAEWYRAEDVRAQFELAPGNYAKELGRELSRLGYFHAGFHTSLIREPEPPDDDAHGAGAGDGIERVTSAEQFDAFLDAYTAGWQIPEKAGFKTNVQAWLGLPGWQLYLARVDGLPAAAGILFLHDNVGYCADAATDPAFRRRGLQAALLRRRIADAHAAGVEFVCSGAGHLSTSHRSMERVGMRVRFVRALWRELA
jgi:ribosomal protein S18 acetylase RimI-like enzyme